MNLFQLLQNAFNPHAQQTYPAASLAKPLPTPQQALPSVLAPRPQYQVPAGQIDHQTLYQTPGMYNGMKVAPGRDLRVYSGTNSDPQAVPNYLNMQQLPDHQARPRVMTSPVTAYPSTSASFRPGLYERRA